VKSFWFGARVKVGTSPLVISAVQPESPAGRSGLKVGDALLQVNGTTPKSFIDFADLLATNSGADVTLAIQRGTNRSEVAVRLVPEKSVFNPGMIRDKLGLSLEELSPQSAARYGVDTSDGFIITGVQTNGPAGAAGLQNGMLVRAVDGQTPPADVTGFAKLLYAKKKGEPVRLDIALAERVGNFNVLRPGTVELVPR
jgi:S1-C subfamily serine protease